MYRQTRNRLCEEMGFNHCILFDMGRTAIAAWAKVMSYPPVTIPTNCCPALAAAFVGCKTSLSWPPPRSTVVANLYGRRLVDGYTLLEIDPHMTGCRSALGKPEPKAASVVLSFGYSKTIEAGGGGALLTNDTSFASQVTVFSNFHHRYEERLHYGLDRLGQTIGRKRDRERVWAKNLGRVFEPVVPWRFIKTVPYRTEVVAALRTRGIEVGTNYPPLYDRFPSFECFRSDAADKWGSEVINLWTTENVTDAEIAKASSIIKRTIDVCSGKKGRPTDIEISHRSNRNHPRRKQQELDGHSTDRHA